MQVLQVFQSAEIPLEKNSFGRPRNNSCTVWRTSSSERNFFPPIASLKSQETVRRADSMYLSNVKNVETIRVAGLNVSKPAWKSWRPWEWLDEMYPNLSQDLQETSFFSYQSSYDVPESHAVSESPYHLPFFLTDQNCYCLTCDLQQAALCRYRKFCITQNKIRGAFKF